MRGYFGIGVENVSKAMNAGAVMRTAHAFGANFSFFVGGPLSKDEIRLSDTSNTENSLPTYYFNGVKDLSLPKGCKLVGIELLDDAEYLPSFKHPRLAAYILGSERYGLSKEILEKCGLAPLGQLPYCNSRGTLSIVSWMCSLQIPHPTDFNVGGMLRPTNIFEKSNSPTTLKSGVAGECADPCHASRNLKNYL